MYTYDITAEEREEDWVWSLCRQERLALVLLDIGKCARRALSERELAKAGRIFSLFRDNGMQMIVRIAYDRVGRGLEHEPETIGQVIWHMRQFAPLFAAFSAHILTIQGLFIGSWGEMHDSKFLEKESLLQLFAAMREAAGEVKLSVRKPQYQRMLQSQGGVVTTGLYDDAILASGTDMGTFGWIDDVSNPDIMWTPERELEFMQVQNARTLCGGEVLAGALLHSPGEVLARMRLMQLTYLNSVHEPVVWEHWRSPEYRVQSGEGTTLCEEIRGRLGYRYELTGVELVDEAPEASGSVRGPGKGHCGSAGERLRLTITNTGFACCYDAVRVILGCGRVSLEALLEGRALPAGEALCVEFDIREACARQGERALPVCIALRHERTGLPIYFADAACDSFPDKWERYRPMSSLTEGVWAGVLFREKDAIS